MRRGRGVLLAGVRGAARLELALMSIPLLGLALASWIHRNIIDDGFIYLRVVHQVTAGHGPVFNIGERVEAFTSPLWLALLSGVDLLTPFRLEWLAVGVGIATTLIGMALAMLGSARLARKDPSKALLVPFGGAVLAALMPMWLYASSGLETGVTFLWLGSSLWVVASWAITEDRLTPPGAFILGLGWLVRPELIVYSVGLLATIVVSQWRRDTWRTRAALVVAAFAIPAAYQVFRMGYYGAVVANTAIAKEATKLRWHRGSRYLADFFGAYWFLIPVVVMVAGGYIPMMMSLRDRHRRAVYIIGAFAAASLVNAIYIVAVGGDYEHARLLMPAVFAFCAPVAVIPLTRRYVVAAAMAAWIAAAVFVLRAPTPRLGRGFVLPSPTKVTLDERGWGPGGPYHSNVSRRGNLYLERGGLFAWFRTDLPVLSTVRQPVAATSLLGIPSYAISDNVYVFDLLGLADPLTARLEVPLRTTLLPLPGHEKPLPRPWIVARLLAVDASTDLAELPKNGVLGLIPPTTGQAFADQVAVAKATLRCPPVRRLQRSVSGRLSIRRFLANVRDSFANTRLRIPPDPEQAYRRLCRARARAGG